MWWFLASTYTFKTVDCRNIGKNTGKGGKLKNGKNFIGGGMWGLKGGDVGFFSVDMGGKSS